MPRRKLAVPLAAYIEIRRLQVTGNAFITAVFFLFPPTATSLPVSYQGRSEPFFTTLPRFCTTSCSL